MDSLLANTRPLVFGLIGIIPLFYSHLNARKQWDEKPPKVPSHLLIRGIVVPIAFAPFAFIVSAIFTTGLAYALLNTVFIVLLFSAYIYKAFSDMKSWSSKKP
jgi:hypothetical protein